MPFLADLHVHSRYSRATSQDMSPEGLWRWGQLKGIGVVGTGDLTHPAWLAELDEKLEPLGNGLFGLRKTFRTGEVPASCRSDVAFLLTGEISCIYRKNGKTRKVHSVVLMPDRMSVDRLNAALGKVGNLQADGRPILGLDAKELLSMTLDASPDAVFIPAHAWTPHFSVFGSQSGFDSLEECFDDLAPHVRAIETGLSSDPRMNRRLSALDGINLVSFSDAHSPAKLGREATIIDGSCSFRDIAGAIRTGRGLNGTIEFFPEEGKYHFDGHRACGVCLPPEETVRYDYRCPSCGGRLTVGVLHRVDALADRMAPPDAERRAFVSLIPLAEIIAETLGCGVNTKKVNALYEALLDGLGPELAVLRDASPGDISRLASPLVAEAVSRMRTGKVSVTPGYDGAYGRVRIFADAERQAALFLPVG